MLPVPARPGALRGRAVRWGLLPRVLGGALTVPRQGSTHFRGGPVQPAQFPEVNVTLAKDQPPYRPPPAHRASFTTPGVPVVTC